MNANFAKTYAAQRSPEPYVRNRHGFDKNAAMPVRLGDSAQSLVREHGSETIGIISPVQVDGGPASAGRYQKAGSIRLRQLIEVVPEAAYTCAVWIKGKGNVTIESSAQTPAAGQNLGTANQCLATANWTEIRLPRKNRPSPARGESEH